MDTLTGTLTYSPDRPQLKKQGQANILVLNIGDNEITKYYSWLVKQKYGQCLTLQPPMFETHVTVIRPQEANIKNPLWGKHEGRLITIDYNPEDLERHWEFWSLTVRSKELDAIREEFGLRTDFRLHMTIGRQLEWQPRPVIDGVAHDTDYTTGSR